MNPCCLPYLLSCLQRVFSLYNLNLLQVISDIHLHLTEILTWLITPSLWVCSSYLTGCLLSPLRCNHVCSVNDSHFSFSHQIKPRHITKTLSSQVLARHSALSSVSSFYYYIDNTLLKTCHLCFFSCSLWNLYHQGQASSSPFHEPCFSYPQAINCFQFHQSDRCYHQLLTRYLWKLPN